MDKRAGKDVKLFPNLPTSKAGTTLRGLRPKGVKVTTRCFRNHFAGRMYAESGGDAQHVSKEKGHRNPRMAGAFYLELEGDHVVQEYCNEYGYALKG